MSPKAKKSPTKAFLNLLGVIFIVGIYFAYLSLEETETAVPQPSVQGINTTFPPAAPNTVLPNSDSFEVYFTNPAKKFTEVTNDSIEIQLIAKIDTAKTSLHGAFFEFDLQSVADALINAKNRGVDVQLVYDDEHTEDDPQIAEMIKAGIEAVPDERSAFMHNKFLVVDNQCVWMGSFNLTVNAAYKNNEDAFYYCHPDLADNYQTEFTEMFRGEFGTTSTANTPHPQFVSQGVQFENYFAPEDNVMAEVVAEVVESQTSIHFLAFSFTDDKLAETVLFRKMKGVDIKGIFESRGAGSASSQCSQLLRNGADVRLDGNSYTLHHKVIIIDSKTVIFGSFNFSENADKNNDENLLIVHSAELAQKFEQEFQKLLSISKAPSASCGSD